MIWLKIAMAAMMSGALFSVVEVVLPPREPQPFLIEISDWPGDRVFSLIEPLGLAPSKRLVLLDIRSGTRDAVEAFRAGLVDAAVIGLERLPELLGDEVRVIYVSDEGFGGGEVLAAPGVMRAADLGNRPVGVSFGGRADPVVQTLLSRAGLDARRAGLVVLAPEAVESALRTGKVGAAVVLSPMRAKAIRDKLGVGVLAAAGDVAGLSTHVLVVREGRIPDRRAVIVSVLRAASDAARTCRGAMERCLELLASASGRPAAEWRQDFEPLHLLGAAESVKLLGGGNDAPLARRLNSLPGRAATVQPAAMEWLDPSLAEEAARP